MKSRTAVIALTALSAGFLLCSTAMAQNCSDPAPTPTPTYDMDPSVELYPVETPMPPEETPASREYCREQKSLCKTAIKDKKKTVSKEKSKKKSFNTQKRKASRIASTYNKCRATKNRALRTFKTRIQLKARACGPSLENLINQTVTVDFFQCRSNQTVVGNFLQEALNSILANIVQDLQNSLNNLLSNPTELIRVVRSCTLTEAGLILAGGVNANGVSASCRNAVTAAQEAMRSEAAERERACQQMERYQQQAEMLATGFITCEIKKASQTDRHHQRLADLYANWLEALTDKQSAAAAEPILCREYNRHCRR